METARKSEGGVEVSDGNGNGNGRSTKYKIEDFESKVQIRYYEVRSTKYERKYMLGCRRGTKSRDAASQAKGNIKKKINK